MTEWRPSNGAIFPVLTSQGDVKFAAVVSLTSDDPLRSLAHEGFHIHVREGRVRNDELRLFASDDQADLDVQQGFDHRPLGDDLRFEERGAALAGRRGSGRAAGKAHADRGVDPDASGRRPTDRPLAAGLSTSAADYFGRFVKGEVGRRLGNSSLRRSNLFSSGYIDADAPKSAGNFWDNFGTLGSELIRIDRHRSALINLAISGES